MDLIKIGKYIADKRKTLGLTQRQLADQLAMSDKSVSKWERGVCLPDVSVYMELCKILGISINEFLAGEDIEKENIEQKSEENIIQVTQDGKHKRIKMKKAISILIVISIIFMAIAASFAVKLFVVPSNYFAAFDENSTEMETAELLSQTGDAHLFKYSTNEKYKKLIIYESKYQNGKQIGKSVPLAAINPSEGDGKTHEGVIAIVVNDENSKSKVVLSTDGFKVSSERNILEGVKNKEYMVRTYSQLSEPAQIKNKDVQDFLVLSYGNEHVDGGFDLNAEGEYKYDNEYDLVYSYKFSK